jgi:ABC-type glycerol-3-phosphate transport system permease component
MTVAEHRSPRRDGPARVRRLLPQTLIHLVLIVIFVLAFYPVVLIFLDSVKTPLQYEYDRWTLSLPMRLDNYVTAWQSVDGYVINTLIVTSVSAVGVLLFSLIGGHVFARMRFPFREPLYYLVISLLMIPWIVSFVPQFLEYKSFGLLNTYLVLIIPTVASGPVFGIFLLRTYIQSLPGELYEAAEIDGAGWATLIFRLTLPLVMPMMAVILVQHVVYQWNSFLWPLVTISSSDLQVISVGLYSLTQNALSSQSGTYGIWGPVFASYVLGSIPLAVLFLFLGRFYVEGLVSSGLKL